MKSRILLVLVSISLVTKIASADVPSLVPVQGVLTYSAGVPLDGDFQVVFSIYSAESGGEALWSSDRTVAVANGLFAVFLGEIQALDLDMFRQHGELWLGITVGGDDEMQRIRLGTAPYAAYARYAGVPPGMIAMFSTSCPAGWSYLATFEGRFVRGSNAYGAAGGNAGHSHTHSLTADHTHTFSDEVSSQTAQDGLHSHSVNSHNHAAGSYAVPNHSHWVDIGAFWTMPYDPSTRWDWWPATGNPISAGHEHELDPPNTQTTGSGQLSVSGLSGNASPGTNSTGAHRHNISDHTASGTTSAPSSSAVSGGIDEADNTPPYIEVIFCIKD